jgi:uracil-DNA glycosylase
MLSAYLNGLAAKTDEVFSKHSTLFDHRKEFPWLIGALGNPNSGIWFIAENPSLTQVERVTNPDGGLPTIEAQWWASRGDKLFREMLVKHGFKNGSIDSPDMWNCYITNVVKEADYSSHWHEKTQELRNKAAEIWSSVLSWELETSKPRLVIILGNPAEQLLNHLISNRKINLPKSLRIKHYSYIGQRAEGKLGPMHPERIKRYSEDFSEIRRMFNKDLGK